MARKILGSALSFVVAMPSLALAQAGGDLTADQKGYIAYDQCMMHAAIRASHTDAEDEEIFGLARDQCARTRAEVIVGQEGNREYLAALDAADADKATNFPAWIKGVRERRKGAMPLMAGRSLVLTSKLQRPTIAFSLRRYRRR